MDWKETLKKGLTGWFIVALIIYIWGQFGASIALGSVIEAIESNPLETLVGLLSGTFVIGYLLNKVEEMW